jgi:hypothetical protein
MKITDINIHGNNIRLWLWREKDRLRLWAWFDGRFPKMLQRYARWNGLPG